MKLTAAQTRALRTASEIATTADAWIGYRVQGSKVTDRAVPHSTHCLLLEAGLVYGKIRCGAVGGYITEAGKELLCKI